MTIFYRLSPNKSFHEDKRPLFAHDKYNLAKYCLNTFYKGFADLKPKVIFILDSCGPEWTQLVRECPFDYEIDIIECNSQAESYLYQLQRAKEITGNILFQEDDYVYLPNIGLKLDKAISLLGFVSPYDHPEMYDVAKNCYVVYIDHHYRSVPYNTMTWGCTNTLLQEHYESLVQTGYWDKPTFDALATKDVVLWSPIPSFATHMHKDFLAPCIDWKLCG